MKSSNRDLKKFREISVNLHMRLRKATEEDIDDLMRIFSEARLAQRLAGFKQWEDGYPSAEILKSDIHSSIGYILDDNGDSAGYVAISANDGDYDRHPELWDISQPYAVFHRIAISDDYRGKKLSGILFDLAESNARQSGVEFIRIDTGLENKPMQHILAERGYANLGYCRFVWGERLAYEKKLSK